MNHKSAMVAMTVALLSPCNACQLERSLLLTAKKIEEKILKSY